MASLKRFVPRTLFGRSLLIIVTPLVLLQLVTAYIFFERHWDTVGRHLALNLANDIATIINLIEAFPEEGDQAFILWTAWQYLALETRFEPGGTLPDVPEGYISILKPVLERTLDSQLGRPFVIDTVSRPRQLVISVQLDGRVLHVVASRKRVFSTTTYIFIMWMVGASIILLAIAIFFLRNQVRSVGRLAEAADRLGKGQQVPDFKPEGASEVRQAAAAFLVMRDRIQRQIAQRTAFARRRKPRPAHAVDPNEAPACIGRRGRGYLEPQVRHRRNGEHDRWIPRLRPRRGGRGAGPHRYRQAAGRRRRERPPPGRRHNPRPRRPCRDVGATTGAQALLHQPGRQRVAPRRQPRGDAQQRRRNRRDRPRRRRAGHPRGRARGGVQGVFTGSTPRATSRPAASAWA